MASDRQHRPWLWAVTSTAVIALGVYLLGTLPATFGGVRRYAGAEVCAGDGGEPPRCREVVPAVVEDRVTVEGRRGDDQYLDLRIGEEATFPPPQQPKRVEIEDTFGEPEDEAREAPVYDGIDRGDRVEVTYWGRQLVRVTKPGVGSVDTIASPTFDAGVGLSVGPLCPLLGGLGWWGAIALRRRSGSWTKKTSFGTPKRPLARALGGGAVFGISLLVIAAGDSVGTDIWMVVVLWLLGAATGAALIAVLLGIGHLIRRLRK